MTARKLWSEYEDALLRQMAEDGHGCGAIAQRMKRTVYSVTNRAKLIGVRFRMQGAPAQAEKHIDAIAAMVAEGLPFVDISRRLGVPIEGIRIAARKHGIAHSVEHRRAIRRAAALKAVPKPRGPDKGPRPRRKDIEPATDSMSWHEQAKATRDAIEGSRKLLVTLAATGQMHGALRGQRVQL